MPKVVGPLEGSGPPSTPLDELRALNGKSGRVRSAQAGSGRRANASSSRSGGKVRTARSGCPEARYSRQARRKNPAAPPDSTVSAVFLTAAAWLGERPDVKDKPALAGLAACNADKAIAFRAAGNQFLVVAAPAVGA
jgi:hypothetical protein